ncbi:MAG: CDP-diacylglycerol O-phosphatidyltransferase [Bacteroidetes bacterium]|nr:CDP-diacylglycerol O-phosphatidyltransferase [Bacteroidota bacterium]
MDFLLSYLACLIPVFSALRLAKFNIDSRQTDYFIGLPTPANAILICSLPLILYYGYDFPGMNGNYEIDTLALDSFHGNFIVSLLTNTTFLILLTILVSYILVSELPLFALKFKNFSWENNKIRYLFLIISLILLILFKFIAIPFIIFLYIILSIINNISTKMNQPNP